MSELNAEIARALGYTVRRGVTEYDGMDLLWEVWDRDGKTHKPVKYDTDPAAALGLLEYVTDLPSVGTIAVRWNSANAAAVCYVTWGYGKQIIEARADTLPAAIATACRDALQAIHKEQAQ